MRVDVISGVARNIAASAVARIGREVEMLERAAVHDERYLRLRLKELVLEFFRHLAATRMTSRIEQLLRQQHNADWDAVHKGLALLDAAVSEVQDVNAKAEARNALEQTKELVAKVENDDSSYDIGVVFEYLVESNVRRALATVPNSSASLRSIETLFRQKLLLLSDAQRWNAWRRVCSEVAVNPQSADSALLSIDETVVSPGFFATPSDGDIATKLSEYYVAIRPKLVKIAFDEGRQVVAQNISIAWALTWTKAPDATEAENALVQSVCRLFHFSSLVFHDPNELMLALGTTQDTPIRRSKGYSDFDLASSGWKPTLLTVLAELETVIARAAAFFAFSEERDVSLLRRYKLAVELEAYAGLLREGLAPRATHELRWQNHLAAYLVRHGCFAFGTQFGKERTDFVLGEQSPKLIVEVKLLPARGRLTSAALNKPFTQLRQYLDERFPGLRGVVLMVNATEYPIHAPAQFFGDGRIAFLALNIGAPSPSKLRGAWEVAGSTDPNHWLDIVKTPPTT